PRSTLFPYTTPFRSEEPAHGGEPQGDLRVARDAEHRHVPEAVEVVLGDATLAQGLLVGDPRRREADLGDEAAKVGVGIVDAAERSEEHTSELQSPDH